MNLTGREARHHQDADLGDRRREGSRRHAGDAAPRSRPPSRARRSFVVSGGYHLCNVEFPHIFNERVLAFLLGRESWLTG